MSLPVKAVQRLQAMQKGGPLRLVSVPMTIPGPTEVCISLKAIGLNPLDCKQLYKGEMTPTWPATFGVDGAGIVEAIGKDVTKFQVGDMVLSLFGHGERAAAFQEVAAVPEWHVAKLPKGLSFEQGASLPICYLTALAAIYRGLKVQPSFLQSGSISDEGQIPSTILVVGGSSGVGSAAIQLLRIFLPGATILTTSSSQYHEHLIALGATMCFERASPSLIADIRAATKDSHGVDMILDAVGGASTQHEIFGTLKEQGTRMYSQVFTGDKITVPETVDGSVVFGRMVFEMPGGKNAMSSLSDMIAQGRYKLPLRVEQIGSGFDCIEQGLQKLSKGVSGTKLVVAV